MNTDSTFLNQQRQESDPEADFLVQSIFNEGFQTSLYTALGTPVAEFENLEVGPLKLFLT